MSRMWTPPSRKRPEGGDADRGWPGIPREARPQGGEAPGRQGPRETRPQCGDADRGSPGRPGPREAELTQERNRTPVKSVINLFPHQSTFVNIADFTGERNRMSAN